jgi:hypothetical protein
MCLYSLQNISLLFAKTLKSVPNGRLKKVSSPNLQSSKRLRLTGTVTTDPAVLGWPAHITIT